MESNKKVKRVIGVILLGVILLAVIAIAVVYFWATNDSRQLSKADNYLKSGDFQNAIDTANEIINRYPEKTREATNILIDAYNLWIDEYLSVKNYSGAMDLISNTMEEYKKFDTENKILKKRLSILELVSVDEGSSGKWFVDMVGKSICAGDKIDPDYLAFIGKSTKMDNVFYFCSPVLEPLSLQAGSLSDLKYYVKAEETLTYLPACEYNDGYRLIPQKATWNLKVIDIKTGDIAAEKVLSGSFSSCPYSHLFTSGLYEENLRVNPSISEIQSLLFRVSK